MSLTKPQLIIIAVVAGILIIFVLIFTGIIPGLKSKTTEPTQIQATLNFWVLFDNQSVYASSISGFKEIYPNVTVNVRSFSSREDYEKAVINALAAGSGPDIFMVQNGALLKTTDKLSPVLVDKYSLAFLRSQFPQVVEQDFVYQNKIYALPLSIDTLALIYNRDIFNQNGVALPPSTWEEFRDLVPRFVKQDQLHRITQAGAAIGGSQKTVSRAADILDLLMLQKGVSIVSSDLKTVSISSPKGAEALNFYIQFANAASQHYTWNDTLPGDIKMFSDGKAAMMFDYASVLSELKNRNPFLNFAVALAPQFSQSQKSVSRPHYFGYAVAKQSRYKTVAWDFIVYLTTSPESVKKYSEAAGKPPAFNALISQKVNDPDMGVFARQALTAKSWLKVDPLAVNNLFSGTIEAVITGQLNVDRALTKAQEELTRIISQKSL